jgi:pimeloyl-ACP methyl ester carboxylesterase
MKTDLHVSDIGEGEPIVFIHGALDPAEETFGEQKELADRYHVVLVDRRGYGDSPAADGLDFHAQVEDILSVVGRVLIWWGNPPVACCVCWLRRRTRKRCGPQP